jgi:hypothetical protein
MSMQQDPPSPLLGIAVALGGLVLVLMVNQGFGGAMACGDWGLGCFFKAMLAAGLVFPVATLLLWRAYSQATPGDGARSLAMAFLVPCALVSAAAWVVVLFVFAR